MRKNSFIRKTDSHNDFETVIKKSSSLRLGKRRRRDDSKDVRGLDANVLPAYRAAKTLRSVVICKGIDTISILTSRAVGLTAEQKL